MYIMDHYEARKKVCIICYGKASRLLSSIDIETIRRLVIENYNSENPDFPCGICTPCKGILTEHRSGNVCRSLPVASDYNPGTQILTRGQSVCSCRICTVAKANGAAAKALKRKRGRPSSSPVPAKKYRLCNNCYALLFKGCSHSSAQCRSKKERLANISSNILGDDKTKQQVASQVVKDMSASEKSTDVQLSTLGSPLEINIHAKKTSNQSKLEEKLTTEDLVGMQLNAGLSDRQLFTVLKDIQIKFGRKSVEANIRNILVQRKTVFSDLFSKENIDFLDSKGLSISRPFVYCNDTQEFIDRIMFLRGDDSPSNIDKLGFDDGKEILKLTLSVYDPDDKIPTSSLSSSRVTRSRGITVGSEYLNSGVNKTFLLAAAPKTPETYDNCKIFLGKTECCDISFHFAADLKMSNICLGIMSHDSLHPCAYCEGTKNVFERDAVPRTLASISENYNKWRDESGKKTTLKNYNNCANEPLLQGSHDLSTPVLNIVPPPSLHIKLGIVNKLYSELQKLFPQLDQWPAALYIQQESYHGNTFEGNECNRLLKNLDMLRNMLPPHLISYYECFLAFRDAMHACLGYSIDPDFKEKVSKFEQTYMALDISVTTKVHIMTRHVPEYLEKHCKPLGHFSEQVVEQCHAKFDRLFNSYRIKNIQHPNYLEHLYRAIMHFNSHHI